MRSRLRVDAWMSAMRRGDFTAAWKVSDRVLRRRLREGRPQTSRPRHLQALWDGRALRGRRVLVRCYHGLGDTLQFVRLLPLLRDHARHVTLWAQPALLDLLRTAPGIDRLEPLHDGEPRIERDADIELMELPHILRLRCADIPAQVPYLHVGARRRRGRSRRLRIGIAWRAGDWNPLRSLPDALLAPLASVPDVSWISLQYGARAASLRVVDHACRDLVEQARRMQSLDLIVSVDTMTAHLAGALGLPVWLLLPYACDWRWMSAREDSPWYPTMRLLRQPRPGDWASVVARICVELRQHPGIGDAHRR